MADYDPREILREMASLRGRVRRAERSVVSLAHSSIEDGAVLAFDQDGTQTLQIGLQHDNTHVAASLSGPQPPTPTAPVVDGHAGYLNIVWNGGFEAGQITPMDFSRVEIYVSTDPITVPYPSLLVGTIETPQGATATLGAGTGTYYIRLASRSLSGKVSALSAEVTATVTAVPSAEAVQEVLDAANGKNKITFSIDTPSIDGTAEGDIWFQRDGDLIVGQWRWTGADWAPQEIDGQVIANLDAGRITTGTLAASRIAAGTITVDKLIVGSSGNLIPDPVFRNTLIEPHRKQGQDWTVGFDDDGTRFFRADFTGPNQTRQLYPATTTEAVTTSALPVEPGRSYRFTALLSGNSDVMRCMLRLDWYSMVGTTMEYKSSVTSHAGFTPPGEPLNAPVQLEWVTPEAPWEFVVPVIQVATTSAAPTGAYFAKVHGQGLVLESMVDVNSIPDASILTDKLAAGAVTAEKIAVGAITAEQLGFGVLSSNLLRNPGFEVTSEPGTPPPGDSATGTQAQQWDILYSNGISDPWVGRRIWIDSTSGYRRSGNACLRIQHQPHIATNSAMLGATAITSVTHVTPGEQFRFGAWARAISGPATQDFKLRITWMNSLGYGTVIDVSPPNNSLMPADGWRQFVTDTLTAPAGAASVSFAVTHVTSATAGTYDVAVDDAFAVRLGRTAAEITSENIRMWDSAGTRTVDIAASGERIFFDTIRTRQGVALAEIDSDWPKGYLALETSGTQTTVAMRQYTAPGAAPVGSLSFVNNPVNQRPDGFHLSSVGDGSVDVDETLALQSKELRLILDTPSVTSFGQAIWTVLNDTEEQALLAYMRARTPNAIPELYVRRQSDGHVRLYTWNSGDTTTPLVPRTLTARWIGGRYQRTISLSVPNATFTNVPWATVFEQTPAPGVALRTSAAGFTIPIGGVWEVNMRIGWNAASTGRRLARLLVNGVESVTEFETPGTHSTARTTSTLGEVAELNTGDVLTFQVYQDSGGALETSGSTTEQRAWLQYRGDIA